MAIVLSRGSVSTRGWSDLGDLAFHLAHAASPEPDQVVAQRADDHLEHRQIRDLGEKAFVSGSLDNNTIVDRKFRPAVLENRYLKVVLLPESAAHSFHHLQADRPRTTLSHRSRRALWNGGDIFYYDWLMCMAASSHLAGCRARQDLAKTVGFKVVKQSAGEVDGAMSLTTISSIRRRRRSSGWGFRRGPRIEATYYVTLNATRRSRCAHGAENRATGDLI